jgi:hypothetical protein
MSIAAALRSAKHTAKAPLHADPAAHLLSRFAFGPTLSQRKAIELAGGGEKWAAHHADAWYRKQVELGRELSAYSGVRGLTGQYPLLALAASDVATQLTAENKQYGWNAMDQLSRATLILQTYSPAQLYESLVMFFADHLHVPNRNGDVWATRAAYDRDVIRAHAMGSFTDMLIASSKHPAMLQYLNLAQSTKSHPNENYAREMLELHTVGLSYTQQDVTNTAALLTGRTVTSPQSTVYTYNPKTHATGAVQVLGFSDPNKDATGEAAGDALLTYLATHPDTAQHLARKICIRFVSDNPSQALVTAVANAYLTNQTQILPMVSTILHSHEFWQSRGAKVRRPTENLIATVRALGVHVTQLGKAAESMQWQTSALGHAPMEWPAPNGYPDVASEWRSSGAMLDMWEYHLSYIGHWWKGFAKLDADRLYSHPPRTSGEAIDLLTKRLTGATFSGHQRTALQAFLNESRHTPMHKSTIRWNQTALVALILHSPQHAMR